MVAEERSEAAGCSMRLQDALLSRAAEAQAAQRVGIRDARFYATARSQRPMERAT